jgi:hypothetical protein
MDDAFAVAMTLYECLCYELPFASGGPLDRQLERVLTTPDELSDLQDFCTSHGVRMLPCWMPSCPPVLHAWPLYGSSFRGLRSSGPVSAAALQFQQPCVVCVSVFDGVMRLCTQLLVPSWHAARIVGDDACEGLRARVLRAALASGAVRVPPLLPRPGVLVPELVRVALAAAFDPELWAAGIFVSVRQLAEVLEASPPPPPPPGI